MSLALATLVLRAALIPPAGATPVPQRHYAASQLYFSVAATPDWVEPVSYSPDPRRAADSGRAVAYLLADRQVRVAGASETRYVRNVTRPLNEAGLGTVAEIEVDYNPAFQALTLHHIDVVRAGTRASRLQPEAVRLIQREDELDQKLFDGQATAVIILDDVRVGDVVDVAYSVAGRNPVFGDRYFSTFALGWGVPVDKLSVRLLVPRSRPLRTRSYRLELAPEVSVAGDTREYRWVRSAVPAVTDEGDYPEDYQPYPWLQVSEYRDWAEVAAWAAGLYAWDGELDAGLQGQVDRWRGAGYTAEQAIGHALRYVQGEIRYLGIEVGQNSHRPAHPNAVHARRYGDCKDKALLLTAILNELGIRARPALVSTVHSGELDAQLSSPGVFDHVVVMAQAGDRTYWLDATRSPQYGPLASLGFPDYGFALPASPQTDGLVAMARPPEAIPAVEVTEQFRASSYHAPVAFTVESTYSGAQAETMRRYFATYTPEEASRNFLGYYAKLYPSITLQAPVVVHDDRRQNTLSIRESYAIPDFWQVQDATRYAHLYGSTVLQQLDIPRDAGRTGPLAVSHPVRIRHTTALLYPEAVDYAADQGSVHIEDRFVAYSRQVNHDGRSLTIEHHYRTKQDRVMPAQLAAYVDNLNAIEEHLYFDTWMDASETGDVDSMVSRLLDRLQEISARPAASRAAP